MRSSDRIEILTPTRLDAVLAVAASGSFSEAAKELGSSQSSVSRAVAAVERALGTTLFDRSTRSVRLTPDGREFAERATLVRSELVATVDAMRAEVPPTPRLVLASLSSISELHLAAAIASCDPGPARLRCIERLQAGVVDAVASGRAVAGIGDLAQLPAGLRGRPLWTEPFRLAVPTGHRLARRRRVGLDDLAHEPLVSFSRDAELRTTLDRELAAARRLRSPDLVVDRFRTALGLVAAGLGVMVVPAISAPGLPPGARLVDIEQAELRRTVGVLTLPEVTPPPTVDAIVDGLLLGVTAIPDVEAV